MKSGIDTEQFSAHSTRSASTLQACANGIPVSEILKMANWSSSSTFERFASQKSRITRAVQLPEQLTRYVL